MSKEAYYDEHIAPKLLELGEVAIQRSFRFRWFASGNRESTEARAISSRGAASPFAWWMPPRKASGNVDGFMMAIERHARKHGHGSMYLHMRGVPVTLNSMEVTGVPALSARPVDRRVRGLTLMASVRLTQLDGACQPCADEVVHRHGAQGDSVTLTRQMSATFERPTTRRTPRRSSGFRRTG